MRGKVILPVLVSGFVVIALATPVAADPPDPPGSRDPMTVAQAMFADPSQVTAAVLGTDGMTSSSASGLASSPGPMAGFPTNGPNYGMISSGNTNGANDPNAEENKTTDDDSMPFGSLSGLNTNEGNDLSGIEIAFNAPALASPCLQVDVKFLSDEFDEFIGSQFNDFAVGRLDNTSPPTVMTGASGFPEVQAPGNFLLDPSGSPITVNGAYLVGDYDHSTTYDNATPKLTAQTAVTAGSTTVMPSACVDHGFPSRVCPSTLSESPAPTRKRPVTTSGAPGNRSGRRLGAIVSSTMDNPADVKVSPVTSGAPMRR